MHSISKTHHQQCTSCITVPIINIKQKISSSNVLPDHFMSFATNCINICKPVQLTADSFRSLQLTSYHSDLQTIHDRSRSPIAAHVICSLITCGRLQTTYHYICDVQSMFRNITQCWCLALLLVTAAEVVDL